MGEYYNTCSGWDSVRQALRTAINAKNNQNPDSATATTTAAIVQPVGQTAQRAATPAAQQAATLPPATTRTQYTKPAKTWKDYLLWIALGGAVAFGAYKMLTGKKKRR